MNIPITYYTKEITDNKHLPLDESYIIIKGNRIVLYYGMIYLEGLEMQGITSKQKQNEMSFELLNTPFELINIRKYEEKLDTDKKYMIDTNDVYIPIFFFNLKWYQYLILKVNKILFNHTAIVIAILALIVSIIALFT
ncbi:hypothetical protein [Galbibacter sp. BG1]